MKFSYRGGASTAFILMLAFLIGFSIILVSGAGVIPSQSEQVPSNQTGSGQIIVTDVPPEGLDNLQLRTFGIISVTPTVPPSTANACISNPFNDEPDIFYGSDPAPGGIAVAGSQIKVWINDGNGGSVADGTVADPITGLITTPGDRTASDGTGRKQSSPYNYYLWEPALYLTPVSTPSQAGPFSGDAENGGTPHFPNYVKGEASQADTGNSKGFIGNLPPIDPPVNIPVGRRDHGGHIAEYIWDVNGLGITAVPGAPQYYRVQIVTHDGDGDLAISCTTIQI